MNSADSFKDLVIVKKEIYIPPKLGGI